MTQTTATLIAAAVVIVSNLLTAAFVYGQLTQKVKNHEGRILFLETVSAGRDGFGERISRLEGIRHPKGHHGD
jgi:hypothetical protein